MTLAPQRWVGEGHAPLSPSFPTPSHSLDFPMASLSGDAPHPLCMSPFLSPLGPGSFIETPLVYYCVSSSYITPRQEWFLLRNYSFRPPCLVRARHSQRLFLKFFFSTRNRTGFGRGNHRFCLICFLPSLVFHQGS